MISVFLDPTQMPNQSQDQATFDKLWAGFLSTLPTFGQQFNAGVSNLNASLNGAGISIPYAVDLSTTADADPGNGNLRFNSATQNAATVLRLDLLSSNTADYTAMLDTFDSSTSTNKGRIAIVKQGDAKTFLMFDVTARAAPSGYRNITVTPVASSSANPFTQGDPVFLFFQRTGDIGSTGTAVRRAAPTITNPASITPNIANYDNFAVISQAQGLQILAPSGTLTDGRTIAIRVKDNGAVRALAFDTIYRASSELPLPTATIAGKVTYMGFQYNADDAKWDLLAMLQTM